MLDFCFNTGQLINGKLFCSCARFNGLFQVDLYTGISKYVGQFPNENITGAALHRESFVYNDCIIFIPHAAKGISIYDVKKNSFEYYEVGESEKIPMSGCLINDILWLFAINSDETIRYMNLKTRTLEKLPNVEIWTKKFFQRVVYANGSIWAAEFDTNKLLEFVVDSKEEFVHELMIDEIKNISSGKEGLWLITKNENSVFQWKFKSYEISQYSVDKIETCNTQPFSVVLDLDDKVYLIPLELENVQNLVDNRFKKMSMSYDGIKQYTKEITPFFLNHIYTSRGWMLPPLNINHMVFINTNNQKMEMQRMDWENQDEYPQREYIEDLQTREGKVMGFEEFLEVVSKCE